MSVVALDVDFHKIYAWSSTRGRLMNDEPDWRPFADHLAAHDTILMEVASPTFYDKKGVSKSEEKAVIINKVKWALFNSRICGEIYSWLIQRYGYARSEQFLVAPSSAWTLSFPPDIRQEMAGATGQDNHDLRECRAMLFFHKRNPKTWVTVPEYWESYTTIKKK